jgi:hypothetical protein
VAGGVVQAQAIACLFFNQKIAAIFFDDGRHGDVGFPASVHLHIIGAA